MHDRANTRRFRRRLGGACCGLLALSLSGCARAHAKSPTEVAPLDIPAPPPRIVEAPGTEAPPPATLPEEPARNPAATRRPPAPRPEPPKEPPKPEQTAPPPEPAKPPEEATRPAPTLQTTPPEREGDVERTIRGQLNRANSDLSRIDYRVLSTEGKTQYDSAKGFVRQAEDALRAKDLHFARSLAEKAAALAAQLAGK